MFIALSQKHTHPKEGLLISSPLLSLWVSLTLIISLTVVLQEAVRYYNQTTMQLQMLDFSKQRLASDDEVCIKGSFQAGGYLRSSEGNIRCSLSIKIKIHNSH